MMVKTYSEALTFNSFEERFKYLSIGGKVGIDTFGFDRYLNQKFYRSSLWQKVRREVSIRDNGMDLAFNGYPIFGRVLVHHINPITPELLHKMDESIIDPENLITVSHKTHNAIHYGDVNLLAKPYIDRSPGDTKLW